MQIIIYAGERLIVADEVATEVLRAASEFGSVGRMIELPVACYFDGRATSVSLIVGAGVPLLTDKAEGPDAMLNDPPETLRSWDWIKTATDDLEAGPV